MLSDIAKYSSRHDKKIKSRCEPLRCFFEEPVFSYYRILADGSFVYLSNFPEQLEFYYSHGLYQTNPYLVHPKLLRAGYTWEFNGIDPEQLALISNAERKFQVQNIIMVVSKPREDCMEGFFFADAKSTKPNQPNLANLIYFEKFTHYFKQEMAPLIDKLADAGYNLAYTKGNDFSVRDSSLPLSSQNEKINRFLKMMTPLSKREQECLNLFFEGHSAQSTAALLGLSRRTVEHYFESIKDKLGCHSKWELLKLK